MKVNIWIHKEDAVNNNITDYHYSRPYTDRNNEWVQITISHDRFVQLEDFSLPKEVPDMREPLKIDDYDDQEEDHGDEDMDEGEWKQ